MWAVTDMPSSGKVIKRVLTGVSILCINVNVLPDEVFIYLSQQSWTDPGTKAASGLLEAVSPQIVGPSRVAVRITCQCTCKSTE